MEIKRYTVSLSDGEHAKITKMRLPIKDFFTRRVNDHDDDYAQYSEVKFIESGNVRCFRPETYCEFHVNFERYEGDHLKPKSFDVFFGGFGYGEEKDFNFKVWLENEHGETFWEDIFDQDAFDYDDFDGSRFGRYRAQFDFDKLDLNLDLDEILTNGKAIFCAECSYPIELDDYAISTADSDFRRALWLERSDKSTDCTLKVEGKEIKASKSILMSQSQVFKSMLEMNTVEAKTGVIEFSDVSYGAVESFLEFLYLGSAQNLDEFAEELFILADMYCVESLKDICLERMVDTLNDSNIFDRLVLAFRWNQRRLKSKALDYVIDLENEQNCETIYGSDKWAKLEEMNEALAEEIFETINKKIGL